MFVLARTWRLPYPSAVLAGMVFALGNFLQAQIHHENIVRTASWLPLILAFVEKALAGRRLARRACAGRRWPRSPGHGRAEPALADAGDRRC